MSKAPEWMRPMERGDAVEVAMRLAERYAQGGAGMAFDEGSWWHYADGRWHKLIEEELINAICDMAGCQIYSRDDKKTGEPQYRPYKVNGFDHQLRALRAACWRWNQGNGFFASSPTGICFKDCFVEVIKTDEGAKVMKRKLGPEHKARAGFDFAYDPQAKTPRFDKYLQDIWGKQEDFAERVKLLQEFAGAGLIEVATRYHRALMLQGEAGKGKSTLIHIIEGLFPDGAVSHVGPAEFSSDDKFALLATAKLNTLTESSQAAITSQDRVKSVVEGEWQTVVCKYEKAAQFKPRAAHLFAVNTWPGVPGAHASFWDRWLVLDLPQERYRDGEGEVKELDKLILAEERAGLVAWAIEGARRLLEQDRYTRPASTGRIMEEWKANADSIGIWLASCVRDINLTGAGTKAASAFEAFDKWCTLNRFGTMSSKSFGERLAERGIEKYKNSSVYYRFNLDSTGVF